jgi:two-component sensor histidine kinase
MSDECLSGGQPNAAGAPRDKSGFGVQPHISPLRTMLVEAYAHLRGRRSGRRRDCQAPAEVASLTDRMRVLGHRELRHRTQNLFAVFQAIASRTIEESKTATETKDVLNGRIQALARAYAIAEDTGREGVSLTAMLDRELAGFSKYVNIDGCDITIGPSAAQQFALIIHELATNAFKYGALSVPDGLVSIAGKIDRLNGTGTFSFAWRETGGPPVTAPIRKGFGSVILLDSAKQFSQNVALDYARQGLCYDLQLQLSAIEASKAVLKHESSTTPSHVHAGSD